MTAMKTELDQLADRHLRADPQGVLLDTSQAKSGIVLVHVSSRMAAALGTQHLVWMLVSLLSRQFKVVTEIILDMPKATLHQGVAPFGEKDTLLETLRVHPFDQRTSHKSHPDRSWLRARPGTGDRV